MNFHDCSMKYGCGTNIPLVGGILTPLKIMKVNWDGKIKNIPNHQPVNNVHKYGEPINVYDFSMKYGGTNINLPIHSWNQ